MNAATIAKALGGQKNNSGYTVHCPAHDDRNPSLSITDSQDGNVLVKCHAGCDQSSVISALKRLGLWQTSGKQENYNNQRLNQTTTAKQQPCNIRQRTKNALQIWQKSVPSPGTLVETYLKSRGLNPPFPPTLRFHSGLKHPSGGVWPAMVALVTHGPEDRPMAIHRTFLAHNGLGKASVDPQKMMLGPCSGDAVRLGATSEVLMVGEGIETCLSAMQATGLPAWTALSASALKALELPDDVSEVIILADGDDRGETAAQAAAKRWPREGRCVRIARPPQGMDFNDMLMEHTPRDKERPV